MSTLKKNLIYIQLIALLMPFFSIKGQDKATFSEQFELVNGHYTASDFPPSQQRASHFRSKEMDGLWPKIEWL